jgi:hypothetical protein
VSEHYQATLALEGGTQKRQRNGQMTTSELMTIFVGFHMFAMTAILLLGNQPMASTNL